MGIDVGAMLDAAFGFAVRVLLPIVIYGGIASISAEMKEQTGEIGWVEVMIVGSLIYVFSKVFCPDTWRQMPSW